LKINGEWLLSKKAPEDLSVFFNTHYVEEIDVRDLLLDIFQHEYEIVHLFDFDKIYYWCYYIIIQELDLRQSIVFKLYLIEKLIHLAKDPMDVAETVKEIREWLQEPALQSSVEKFERAMVVRIVNYAFMAVIDRLNLIDAKVKRDIVQFGIKMLGGEK